ncbi:hypothetical protein FOA52_007081 [Chlamydomonas sp. UWO 241]|nr:hypothetical protein FOA52_007081 [Chlamydomonas sp. UWO 241]
MAVNDGGAGSGASQRRTSAKQFVSRLHDKIREECQQISKQRRHDQLSKMRLASTAAGGGVQMGDAGMAGVPPEDAAEAEMTREQQRAQLRQAAREGAARLFQEGQLAVGTSDSSPSATQHAAAPQPGSSQEAAAGGRAIQPGRASGGTSSSPFTPSNAAAGGQPWGDDQDVDLALSDEYTAEALALLEQELYSVLIADELAAIEEEQQAEQQAMAAEWESRQSELGEGAAGSGASGGGGGGSAIPCPVCQRATLVQLHGVVACLAERWQLDLRTEAISLEGLRERLAAAYECHVAAGCCGRLVFSVETAFGCAQMVARCSTCGLVHIVA